MASSLTDQERFDEAATRIREMTERLIDSSKGAGLSTLDAYERSLASILAVQSQLASATQIDWIAEFAQLQAKYLTSISGAYTDAAREMMQQQKPS